MMTRTPLEFLTRYYDGLLKDLPGAREYARSLWAENCVLHFPGEHAFSGEHPALGWQTGVYKPALRQQQISDRKFRLLQLSGDAEVGVSHYLEEFVLPTGERLEAERFCIYTFADDQIVSMRVIDVDPEKVNAFFNAHFPQHSGIQQ